MECVGGCYAKKIKNIKIKKEIANLCRIKISPAKKGGKKI